jgi:tetratricopeptide (TPR) repeat protein
VNQTVFLTAVIVSACVASLAYEYGLWSHVPATCAKMPQDRNADAISRLERLLRLPSLMGEIGKMTARLVLAHKYLFSKRYEEAVAQYEIVLKLPLPKSLRAESRRLLADALEAIGQTERAEEERGKAAATARLSPESPLSLTARAKLLERDQKFTEAIALFEKAASLVPADKPAERAQILLRGSTAAIQAARPDLALRFAEEALALGLKEPMQLVAFNLASTASQNLGDVAKARAYCERMVDVTERTGDPKETAKHKAKLSGILRDVGDMTGAMNAAQEAIKLDPNQRLAHLQGYYTAMAIGQYDGALSHAIAMSRCPSAVLPGAKQREDAIDSLLLAGYWAEMLVPDKALECHRTAYGVFQSDQKLSIYCRSLLAVIYAQLGRSIEVDALISQVDGALPTISRSRTSLLDNYGYLVQASLLAGRPDQALRYHEALMALNPYPSILVKSLVRAGDASCQLGDIASAREFYASASSMNPDLAYARIAVERLANLR